MPDRSDYQPLPQNADDEPDLDPEFFSTATSPTQPPARGIRRMNAPGAIDLRKLDAAFKRFVVSLSCGHASERNQDGQSLSRKRWSARRKSRMYMWKET